MHILEHRLKFEYYIRQCRRCGECYPTYCRRSKFCDDCWMPGNKRKPIEVEYER